MKQSINNRQLRWYFLVLIIIQSLIAKSQINHCHIFTDGFTALDSADYDQTSGDDGSYKQVLNLKFPFRFYGQEFNQLYLNINGNISFRNPLGTYNSRRMDACSFPIIAPFWADVDLVFPSENNISPKKSVGKIRYKMDDSKIIIVWDKVGYFKNHTDKLNTFQLILTDGNDPILPKGCNIAFYYEKMEWTTGDYSSTLQYGHNTGEGYNDEYGISATVGIALGDERSFVQIGSFGHKGTDFHGSFAESGVQWLQGRCSLFYDISSQFTAKVGECNSDNNLYDINTSLVLAENDITTRRVAIDYDGVTIASTNNINYLNGMVNNYLPGIYSDGKDHVLRIHLYNVDDVEIKAYEKIITAPLSCKLPIEPPCEQECIPSFAPIPGQQYVLSAWVKESDWQNKSTFEDAFIQISFRDASEIKQCKASGAIIDGWQRIEQVFTVPSSATDITINLVNTGNGSSFFDDIRIHPFNANMKSFVYDQRTGRLTAQLDENNYASYYEYDEEGNLVRVKKETERGVKTIQESRNSNKKAELPEIK